MTLNEFKAWLDGFSEAFASGSPNKAQWKKINGRLLSVTEHDTGWHYHYSYPGWPTITNPTYPIVTWGDSDVATTTAFTIGQVEGQNLLT
jgi:hypothetical protein